MVSQVWALSALRDLDISPRGIIHVGANTGQEFEEYRDAGMECVLYIEAVPSIFRELEAKVSSAPSHIAFNAVIAEEDGRPAEFYVASNEGQSSSLLPLGWHKDIFPDITYVATEHLTTRRLDSVVGEVCWTHSLDPNVFELLVIDAQGAEMRVLRGAHECLERARAAFIEVSDGGLYVGDCALDDIYAVMRGAQFRLRELEMNRYRTGDALFVKSIPGS